MKKYKRLIYLFSIVLVMSFSFCILSACDSCGNDKAYKNREKFVEFEPEFIKIVQTNEQNYDIEVTMPNDDGVEVYFSGKDVLKPNDAKIEIEKNGKTFKFNITKKYGDYFLFVKSADNFSVSNISLPNMTPYVVSGDGYNQIHYEIAGSESWSSFIDPEGKNVYRSASPTYSDGALEAVATNQNIMESSANDNSPSEEKPYYYIVLDGKNGKSQFVSYSILPIKDAISFFQAEITVKVSPDSTVPYLTATGNYKSNAINAKYQLIVKSGEEIYVADAEDKENNAFICELDISVLEKLGVWYDILLKDVNSGRVFMLTGASKIESDATANGKKFAFYEWKEFLKVAYKNVSDKYEITSSEILLTLKDPTVQENAKPYLVIQGTCESDLMDMKLKLTYSSFTGEEVRLGSVVENQSETEGEFIFYFDLTQIKETNNWHNVILIDGDKEYAVTTDNMTDSEVTYENRIYSTKEYRDEMKINATKVINK